MSLKTCLKRLAGVYNIKSRIIISYITKYFTIACWFSDQREMIMTI